jgi:hypothetical protein
MLMGFAFQLKESLLRRESQVLEEFAQGDLLGVVLARYLLAVEAAADTDMLTSILLLENGRLRHGAAPTLPSAYCEAIDGGEIGPNAGSCGTAAYFGHPIYVTDIAKDPLWDGYRNIALQHGLRACWSTPIHDLQRAIIGTFAIYHLTPRSPTREEVEAIQTITDHVARAIILSAPPPQPSQSDAGRPSKPTIKLVNDNGRQPFREIEDGFDRIVLAIERTMAELGFYDPGGSDLERLRRAKKAAIKGAALARNARLSRELS